MPELSLREEVQEIAAWVEDAADLSVVKGTLVNRLQFVASQLESASPAAVAREDLLLVVVFKTDQANVQRRVAQIMAVAEPSDPSPEYTQAVVVAFPIGEVSANDVRALEVLVTKDAVEQLRIAPVEEGV